MVGEHKHEPTLYGGLGAVSIFVVIVLDGFANNAQMVQTCIGYFLFVLGVVFVYTFVFSIIFNFFISMTPVDVGLMVDISSYLEMIIGLFLAFGFAFQIPIILVTLIKFRWVQLKTVEKNRPYLIVISFVLDS